MDLSKQTAENTNRYPDCSVRTDPAGLQSNRSVFAEPPTDRSCSNRLRSDRSDLTDPRDDRTAPADLQSDPAGDERGYRLVLETAASPDAGVHHDTAIPKPASRTGESHGIRAGENRGTISAESRSTISVESRSTISKENRSTISVESRGEENRKVYSSPYGAREPYSLPGDSGSLALRFSKDIPDRIRKMYTLYEYEGGSMEMRAKNFYRQALFMQDYEDDVPWKGNYTFYFPTYHSLTVSQLRGYFSWRTRVRRGEYCPIPTSTAYLYVYELLNGIGADSPTDRIDKIREFETGFLDSGTGDPRMRKNLHRWIFELAVIYNLPPETAKQYLDPELLRRDEAIAVLNHAENHTDEEVFSALCSLGGDKLTKSPAALYPEKGKRLFREAWLAVSTHNSGEGPDFRTRCFGERKMRPWYPFANAVYYWQSKPEDREYAVNECRMYRCRNGSWLSESYEKLQFNKALFQSFLRETDRMLRLYLKTGRYLKEKEGDTWASPMIGAVIDEDRRLAEEAARPKITIDLSGLDRIRSDALITRDSLLSEEELEELKPLLAEEAPTEPAPPTLEDTRAERAPCTPKITRTDSASCTPEDIQAETDLPLDPVEIRILLCLLSGSSPADIIREHHLMPSLVADAVNEALYDEFGDTVISCDDDELSLIEDYRENLSQMLEGANR